ncbi:cobalamin biosynthesis protein [Thioalkalicoccus limnaeus]|uniref:Cobalamin biosynthesis protein n=1 Tax=Thioalkalicoccus limnaeus TaxID=120681 RepID=A0ABV4BG63_9GAMM
MIVAGIGCRAGCPAETLIALIDTARAQAGVARIDALASVTSKRDEPGLIEAARRLGHPLWLFDEAALDAVATACPTRSEAVRRLVGIASVAEAAALAATAPCGTLILPRLTNGLATCALARQEDP